MSELSKKYHSINIGDINTWDDWHLVPSSRPVINPPEVKTEYVEIPGANGTLDYTEALTGSPVFKDRTGTWEFLVMNGYQEWYELFNKILSYLHGKRFKIVLDDDPSYEYEGRLKLNEWRSEERNSKIVIDYTISPYKKMVAGTANDWLWNDLTFMSDSYIIFYGSFDVSGTRRRIIHNFKEEPVELSITTTALMDVNMSGIKRLISPGLMEHTGLFLQPGDNIIDFSGTGRVTLNYEKGEQV